MKAKDFLNAMQVMDEFTELVSCVYPDKYKIVCMKHGIDERDAMDMYSYLQKMKSGEYWRVSNKPKDYIERVLAMANEAYSLYTNNSLILDMANFGDDLTRILVIFEKGRMLLLLNLLVVVILLCLLFVNQIALIVKTL